MYQTTGYEKFEKKLVGRGPETENKIKIGPP